MSAPLLKKIYRQLNRNLQSLDFSPQIDYTYHPLQYAWQPFAQYLEKYAAQRKTTLLVGMNPGPYGMAQTGIPFGAIDAVRNYLHIDAVNITAPPRQHPARPIVGFACKRVEVSGKRLWGWLTTQYPSSDDFFNRCLVLNYCPVLFYDTNGKNITPDKLSNNTSRQTLYAACDSAMQQVVSCLKPQFLVGIGQFAYKQLRSSCQHYPVQISSIPHPSPANPAANRNWAAMAAAALHQAGVPL